MIGGSSIEAPTLPLAEQGARLRNAPHRQKWPCPQAGSLFEDSHVRPRIYCASLRTGLNQECACGLWRLMTNLHHGRDASTDLRLSGRWSALCCCPECVR